MTGASTTLIALGGLLLLGLLANALGRRTHVPSVTFLLLLGLAIGPVGLDLLPAEREDWFALLAKVALTMIGFLLGHEFTLPNLREHGREVIILSSVLVIVTLLAVSAGLVLCGVDPAVAMLLGAIATATAPAATVAVTQETGADGPFARRLLSIVALDDVWGIAAFGLVAAAVAAMSAGGSVAELLVAGTWELAGGIVFGLVLGVPMAFLTGRLKSGEPTLLEALAFVLICAGMSDFLNVSFLLAAVVMGATVANLARHHERPFREIDHIERPFLVMFFVLAGAGLELRQLPHVGWLAVAYVVLRVAARHLAVLVGSPLAGSAPVVRKWMSVALLPQAGVALGLALTVDERFPELGRTVLPLVITATVVFELIGPPCTRFALTRAGEVRERAADQ